MPLISRYTTTINGGMTFTGNTSGLSQLTGFNQAGTLGSIGAFTSLNPALQVPTFPAGTTLNINQNGSDANLVIPLGSTVLRAELIWGGSYFYELTDPNGVQVRDISGLINDPVIFTPPGGPSTAINPDPVTAQTQTITASSGAASWLWSLYMRSADVTSIVAAAGAGTYSTEEIVGLVEPLQSINVHLIMQGGHLQLSMKIQHFQKERCIYGLVHK